jgi:predicted aldo/keto reductase-like oxidoreductase
MNVVMLVYVFVLFFVLTPGVLVYLPPKASKMVTNLTHAAIFALIWTLTHKMVWRLSSGMEGMKGTNVIKGMNGAGSKQGNMSKNPLKTNTNTTNK